MKFVPYCFENFCTNIFKKILRIYPINFVLPLSIPCIKVLVCVTLDLYLPLRSSTWVGSTESANILSRLRDYI
jgi:hypothetical protein